MNGLMRMRKIGKREMRIQNGEEGRLPPIGLGLECAREGKIAVWELGEMMGQQNAQGKTNGIGHWMKHTIGRELLEDGEEHKQQQAPESEPGEGHSIHSFRQFHHPSDGRLGDDYLLERTELIVVVVEGRRT